MNHCSQEKDKLRAEPSPGSRPRRRRVEPLPSRLELERKERAAPPSARSARRRHCSSPCPWSLEKLPRWRISPAACGHGFTLLSSKNCPQPLAEVTKSTERRPSMDRWSGRTCFCLRLRNSWQRTKPSGNCSSGSDSTHSLQLYGVHPEVQVSRICCGLSHFAPHTRCITQLPSGAHAVATKKPILSSTQTLIFHTEQPRLSLSWRQCLESLSL
ncbi:uncharacterized protein LOC131403669 [Diceros bicornis minor]|uniref:uncharacterized protein LOC131403669 n=1 Tax=Diceros bicornis minor TaxID=77932 RepID=UPI0026F36798|nr:uncharacterized protein LOC131403669 [Diceros bicornis minor]